MTKATLILEDKSHFEGYAFGSANSAAGEVDLATKPNHHLMQKTLDSWLKEEKIPGIFGIDTRKLTQKLRDRGVMLGEIVVDNKESDFWDPNSENLVSKVSVDKVTIHHPDDSPLATYPPSLKIGLLNCGAKKNIIRNLLARGGT